MSYDGLFSTSVNSLEKVSIPLEQGNVLRQKAGVAVTSYEVSIPLEQGNVLRLALKVEMKCDFCLNPFGTGQCLTT